MHATLATAIAFIIGGSFGVILGGMMRAGKLADLDAENADLARRLASKIAANATLHAKIAELLPDAQAHQATVAQRQKALDAARAANAARAALKAA